MTNDAIATKATLEITDTALRVADKVVADLRFTDGLGQHPAGQITMSKEALEGMLYLTLWTYEQTMLASCAEDDSESMETPAAVESRFRGGSSNWTRGWYRNR